MNAVIICPVSRREQVFPPDVRKKIQTACSSLDDFVDPKEWMAAASSLQEADVILSTWGMPKLNEDFLSAAPRLKAVFYAAGTVKPFVTDAAWDRGIHISSAWQANAIPVSEYAQATILLSLKRFWHLSRGMRSGETVPPSFYIPGAFHSKVGLVSLGAIGRRTLQLLKKFEISLFAYDPYLSAEVAREWNVSLVSLEELFRICDVVSLHAPKIPETHRMITGELIASMKDGATLINTARGSLVAEDEMMDVLTRRTDLTAILDVTDPEPAALDSPLRHLPNVILTPHIAGSVQGECARMGHWMAEELERYCQGKPLQFTVTRDMLARMA